MPRKTAGYRYPHATTDARPHDCTWCPVAGAVAARAGSGAEEWGTAHALPPLPDAGTAAGVRRGLFRARSCGKLARVHGRLSVSVRYQAPDGTLHAQPVLGAGGYVLVVQVWPREAARAEITRRVESGEPLPYNPMRSYQ